MKYIKLICSSCLLPHDRLPRGRKTYKYALTVVDVASRYKEAKASTTKESAEVADAFTSIYKWSLLKWPKLLQVDQGREFMGDVSKLMKSHNVNIKRGIKALHRSQAIAERFNRTLAEKLFGYQYAQEILAAAAAGSSDGSSADKRSREWVSRLPDVIVGLNWQPTRLIGGKTPLEAIKLLEVSSQGSKKRAKKRAEMLLPRGVKVRYLYLPGELEGGEHRRASYPIWSLDMYEIKQIFGSDPVVYYLHDSSCTKAGICERISCCSA